MRFSEGGVVYLKNKMRELEKEIRRTSSYKRKRELKKHLTKLEKAQKYGSKNH